MAASRACPSAKSVEIVSRDDWIVDSNSRICADICVRSWTTLPDPDVPVSEPEARSSSASRAKRSEARWMSGRSDSAASALPCAWSRSAV
jgi:hypothetical protein